MRIERVLCPNPGPFTGPGTNTYLVGDAVVAVIDPGPVIGVHREAIERTVGDRRVGAVIVTHTHSDHAPLANPLARDWGVPALGYAPGPGFDPDRMLVDGESIGVGGLDLVAIHTPGHSDDHLCLLSGGVLFTGDHIMGGSSVMVDDFAPYLASLERLSRLDLVRLYPGHGPEIDNPIEVISWYIAHRRQREREILTALGEDGVRVEEVVETVYADVDRSLHPLAIRTVMAHLRKLAGEGRVVEASGRWVGVEAAPNDGEGTGRRP